MAFVERYVDPSYTTNGDGTAPTEAVSPGGVGAWTGIEAAVAGGFTAGQRLNCKASAIDTLSADTTLPTGTLAAPVMIRGYSTTPGDGGIGGYFVDARTGNRLINYGAFTLVESVTFDHNTRFWNQANNLFFDKCELPLGSPTNCGASVKNSIITGDRCGNGSLCRWDMASGELAYCYITRGSNTQTPLYILNMTAHFCGAVCVGNVFDCGGLNAINLEHGSSRGLIIAQNTIYNAGYGIRQSTEDPAAWGGVIANNLIYGCSDYGITIDTATSNGLSIPLGSNAIGAATSGLLNPALDDIALSQDVIELLQDPFVDAPGGDFRLNNLTNGGALCREAGVGPPLTALPWFSIGANQIYETTSGAWL